MRENLYLIFDFDGVIGDTYETTVKTFIDLGNTPDRESTILEMNRYFSSKPDHSRDHTLTDQELKYRYDWTIAFGKLVHETGFELFSDFVAEIERLNPSHLAIVSSGSHGYVDSAIQKTNLKPTHVLAYEDHHSKEEKIELVCKDWGVEVTDVYYFTDSLADVYELEDMIAKEKLFAVTWGFCSRELLLTELAVEQVLDTPNDFAKLFTK